MADQFLALIEEATRGTDPGSGYLGLPVTGSLEPTFTPDDQPRDEFRGQDSALGNAEVVRRSSQWTFDLECVWYPDSEAIGTLFKHALGKAGTRSALDTTAYEGIVYPIANPFGGGSEPLGTKAIGLVVNSDEDGTTKSRYYGGGRVISCEVTASGTDDVKLKFTVQGPGEYIGAEAAAITMPTMPSASPFVSSDLLCYIGQGASRTGTAPDYTAIDEGTMDSYIPDEVTISVTNGLNDKIVMNGIKGPSKSFREGKFGAEITAPIDYSDPSSGFSSADQYKSLFDSTATTGLMFKLDNGELAGSATANYSAILDFPSVQIKADTPTRSATGEQPSVGFTYMSLSDDDKPVYLYTVDQNASY